jgi:hypothetical protein
MNMHMAIGILLSIPLTIFFIIMHPNKKTIDWNKLYNKTGLNLKIKLKINNFIDSKKVTEKFDPLENGTYGYDLWPTYKNSYPEYKFHEMVANLRQYYSNDEIILFFVELELRISHEKYKIDIYNKKLKEITLRLSNENHIKSHKCFHLMSRNQSWHE